MSLKRRVAVESAQQQGDSSPTLSRALLLCVSILCSLGVGCGDRVTAPIGARVRLARAWAIEADGRLLVLEG